MGNLNSTKAQLQVQFEDQQKILAKKIIQKKLNSSSSASASL